ncbi:hypothetical protein AAF712_011435 [Marasmius tenuissimus]|uniref:Uncharacterized protein n=1 Tax=Marasmius tenuissimus TaxID=585030 RepID=A0ABR2ZK26_9AGAR
MTEASDASGATGMTTKLEVFRSLPAARNRCAPPPTFTGPQVEERIAECRLRVQSRVEDVAGLRSQTSELKCRIRALKQQIEDVEAELHATEDSIYEVNGKMHEDKDDLEDLEDLRLVALTWLHGDVSVE